MPAVPPRSRGLRYPVWLGVASFAWAVVGWLVAASASRLAFVPGVETLHRALPGVTVALILANLGFSLHALIRRKVPIDRLLLVTGLQMGLFTTLFFQFSAHIGAECYRIERPTQSWEWLQFSVAHAVRASDVLDTFEAYGWSIQVIKHRTPFVAGFVVAYHVVVDLFVLGIFWALLRRIRTRLMARPERSKLVRRIGSAVFAIWVVVWLLCAIWLRPWRGIDIPLWLGENFLRVLDCPDALDAFDIHWHQVPKEPLESTLTFLCRVWMAVGISLFLGWRMSRAGVRAMDATDEAPARWGRLSRLGSAAAVMVALVGANTLAGVGEEERIADLTAVACGDEPARADLALAAIRRLGPNACDAVGTLADNRSRRPERNLKVIETLGYLGPTAIPHLREIGLGGDPAEAEGAVASLRQIGPKTAPALATVWHNSKFQGVRSTAEAGLRDFGLDAMPHLIAATDLANSAEHLHWFNELDRNWTLRGTDNKVVTALKRLQVTPRIERRRSEAVTGWLSECGSATVPDLVEAVDSHQPYYVWYAALNGLGRLGPAARDAVPDLVKAMVDEDWHLRETAAGALARIDPKWPESVGARRAVPEFVKALADKDASVRNAAAGALAKIDPTWPGSDGARRAVRDLVAALPDKDASVRRAAAGALALIDPEWPSSDGARRAVPHLVAALADADETVRQAAAGALAKIDPKWPESEGARWAVHDLAKALADKDASVRKAAAGVLVKLGPNAKDAIPALIKALGDAEWTVRLAAAGVLGQMGANPKDAVPDLVKALADKEASVRQAAAAALAKIDPKWPESDGARRAVSEFVKALADKDASVRQDAAGALARIDPRWPESEAARQAMPALVKALADKNWHVRRAAASALQTFGPNAKDAVPDLVWARTDKDWRVREAAAEALDKVDPDWPESIGAKRALSHLVEALGDSNSEVREAAAGALGKIGSNAKDAVPDLEKVTTHDDDALVRKTAAEAIKNIRGK